MLCIVRLAEPVRSTPSLRPVVPYTRKKTTAPVKILVRGVMSDKEVRYV